MASEMDRGFIVTGNDFAPTGDTATVRLTATTGTPFLGGTAASMSFSGVIESATRVSGTTVPCGVSETASARVTVVLPDAREATSSSALVMVTPPVITGVTPTVLRSRLPLQFNVNGDDLGGLGDDLTIRFTAPAGTPFLGGTSATLDIDPTLVSPTSLPAELPWDATAADFVADTTCIWPSGAQAHLPSSATFRAELKLVDGTGYAGNEGGTSVAIEGDYAVVGRPYNGTSGSADVYLRTGEAWAFQAALHPSDGPTTARFGHAVAISGDTILVGAPRNSTGAAYVFVRSGVVWREEQILRGPLPLAGDRFGWSVAIEGDFAVIGAPGGGLGGGLGHAWSFTRSATTWTDDYKFQLPTINAWDVGTAVAIWPSSAGPVVFVGTPHGSDSSGTGDTGTVAVWSDASGSWFRTAWFRPAAVAENDLFGWSLTVDAGVLVVGAPGDDHLLTLDNSGSVYVYEGSTSDLYSWVEQDRFWSPQRVADGAFGASVALRDDYLIVGAPGETGAAALSGAAHVYDLGTGSMVHKLVLMARFGSWDDAYGASVGTDGVRLIVGAPGEDYLAPQGGQAYIH